MNVCDALLAKHVQSRRSQAVVVATEGQTTSSVVIAQWDRWLNGSNLLTQILFFFKHIVKSVQPEPFFVGSIGPLCS
jgi:hypothetical protein